jgi:DNA-binding CsgD family transcriptional regulator
LKTSIHAALRLLSELRDRGADPIEWRRHLAKALKESADSDVTMLVEMETPETGPPQIISTTEYGWENGFSRDPWARAMSDFNADPMAHIVFSRFLPTFFRSPVAAAARHDLVPDTEWYASHEYNLIHSPGGLDSMAYAGCQLNHYRDRRFLIILNRALGAPGFDALQLEIVEALLQQISESVGNSLASIDQPSPTQLPTRRREVLDQILKGKMDKEIATDMGIAFDTVRGHVKDLLLFFRVESRAELMARWIAYGQSSGGNVER